MIGIRKAFDQDLHDKHDPRGRAAAIKYFAKKGYEFVENPDKYGIDLVYPEKRCGLEVEVKREWGDEDFIFSTVHVESRKGEMLQHPGPAAIMVFNSTLTLAWVISGRTVLKSPLVEVKNKEVASGEYFYDVSVKEPGCRYVRVV